MQNVFIAAEKILYDIENIIKKNGLYEFEIIPTEDNQNKSPVFHNNNSLGLASWCIQPLFCYVYNRILDVKKNQIKAEDSISISRWLLGALLLNPDILTFWNMRREFIKNGKLDPFEELRFTNIVLFYKSKCFEVFAYRRWILKIILFESKTSVSNIETLFQNEIKIISVAADRYGNNCHAWSHRKDILLMFKAFFANRYDVMLQHEWNESMKWCTQHVSDYSGFTYRQFLLKILLEKKQICQNMEFIKRREIILEFVKPTKKSANDYFLLCHGTCQEILKLLHGVQSRNCINFKSDQSLIYISYWTEDCIMNEELINTFPGHEALWYHRRHLTFLLIALNDSFLRFGFYKIELPNVFEDFNYLNMICIGEKTTLVYENTLSHLLGTAFRVRNRDLIHPAKHYNSYANILAEKFFNLLFFLNLEP